MYQDIRSLEALVNKANSLAKMKQDYLVPANMLTLTSGRNKSYLSTGSKSFLLHDIAARQLATLCNIPYNYYQYLLEEYPSLLDENVNKIIVSNGKNKLLRTLGGTAMGLLSDRYSIFDHDQLLDVAMPIIEASRMRLASCSITDERMFIKLISPSAKAEVKVGDVVNWGVCLTNGMYGTAAVQANFFVYRKVCGNGMICSEFFDSCRHIHLGKKINSMDEYEVPQRYDIAAYLQETLERAVSPETYMPVLNAMKQSMEIQITNPMETVDKIAKTYTLTPAEKSQILFHVMESRDNSLFGLFNATTRASADASNYSRASYMESVGGKILYNGIRATKDKQLLLAA